MQNETVTVGGKDVLVVYVPHPIGEKAKGELKAEIQEAFGDARVLILDQGKSLGTLKQSGDWAGVI
ncbi:hypothetical protein [Palleronia sp. LCG004]|uniref:hypothetical protein n=1 Tax=Palleronia sp. LCG004 TaxID=3079304 RepID=UPI002943BA83|nr:hypothetical protein [Palleronia sp. LCG004]WOI55135.1 hypothetical protein RVY76_08680 [Palleronia sp. LCG004]